MTRQAFIPYLGLPFSRDMTSYVRTALPTKEAFSIIRRTVASLDRNLPVYNLRTLESTIDASLVNERLVASLSALFGALATLLAVIGLYGVMAYTLQQRTREIGIRVALGAQPGNVIRMVMKEVVAIVGLGFAIGLPAAWLSSKLVASLLYGIQPTTRPPSPPLWPCSRASPCLPATSPPRASRIDPLRALHYE